MRAISQQDGKLLVRARVHKGWWGRLWLLVGLVSGLYALARLLASPGSLSLGSLAVYEAIPAFLMLIGVVMRSQNSTAVIDLRSGSIRGVALHKGLTTADVCAVVAFNTIEKNRDVEGNLSNIARWSVGLLRRSKAPGLADEIDGISHGFDPAAAPTYRKAALRRAATAARLAPVLPELKASIRALAQLIERADEAHAWRDGEQLARALQVPMLDLCGTEPVVRPVEELDMSLLQRIAQGLDENDEDPGEPPKGVRCHDEGPLMSISYLNTPAWLTFVGGIFFAAICAGIGLGIHGEVLMVALGATVLVVCPFLPFGTGWSRLTVADAELIVHYGPLRLWSRKLRLADLEALRTTTHGTRALALMSDQKVIRLRTTVPRAAWMAQRLRHRFARADHDQPPRTGQRRERLEP